MLSLSKLLHVVFVEVSGCYCCRCCFNSVVGVASVISVVVLSIAWQVASVAEPSPQSRSTLG